MKINRIGNIQAVALVSLAVGIISFASDSISLVKAGAFWLPKKQLTISIVSIGAQLPTTLDSDFEVSYQGKKVGNIATFLVEIRNSGSEEIRPDDFVQPLTFPITGVDQIHSVEHVDLDPKNPVPFEFESINPTNSTVVLKPLLLNRGESGRVMIRASCDRAPKLTLDARARIAGISKLRFQDGRPKPSLIQTYPSLISLVTMLLLMAVVLGQFLFIWKLEQNEGT